MGTFVCFAHVAPAVVYVAFVVYDYVVALAEDGAEVTVVHYCFVGLLFFDWVGVEVVVVDSEDEACFFGVLLVAVHLGAVFPL